MKDPPHGEPTMTSKRMSRFMQIASSEPCAKSRQALLERKASQILRHSGFYKPMDSEEKAARREAENYKLRAFLDHTRI